MGTFLLALVLATSSLIRPVPPAYKKQRLGSLYRTAGGNHSDFLRFVSTNYFLHLMRY